MRNRASNNVTNAVLQRVVQEGTLTEVHRAATKQHAGITVNTNLWSLVAGQEVLNQRIPSTIITVQRDKEPCGFCIGRLVNIQQHIRDHKGNITVIDGAFKLTAFSVGFFPAGSSQHIFGNSLQGGWNHKGELVNRDVTAINFTLGDSLFSGLQRIQSQRNGVWFGNASEYILTDTVLIDQLTHDFDFFGRASFLDHLSGQRVKNLPLVVNDILEEEWHPTTVFVELDGRLSSRVTKGWVLSTFRNDSQTARGNLAASLFNYVKRLVPVKFNDLLFTEIREIIGFSNFRPNQFLFGILLFSFLVQTNGKDVYKVRGGKGFYIRGRLAHDVRFDNTASAVVASHCIFENFSGFNKFLRHLNNTYLFLWFWIF